METQSLPGQGPSRPGLDSSPGAGFGSPGLTRRARPEVGPNGTLPGQWPSSGGVRKGAVGTGPEQGFVVTGPSPPPHTHTGSDRPPAHGLRAPASYTEGVSGGQFDQTHHDR